MEAGVFTVVGKTMPTEYFHSIKEQTTVIPSTGKKEKSDHNAETYSSLSETKPGVINAAAGRVL